MITKDEVRAAEMEAIALWKQVVQKDEELKILRQEYAYKYRGAVAKRKQYLTLLSDGLATDDELPYPDTFGAV